MSHYRARIKRSTNKEKIFQQNSNNHFRRTDAINAKIEATNHYLVEMKLFTTEKVPTSEQALVKDRGGTGL